MRNPSVTHLWKWEWLTSQARWHAAPPEGRQLGKSLQTGAVNANPGILSIEWAFKWNWKVFRGLSSTSGVCSCLAKGSLIPYSCSSWSLMQIDIGTLDPITNGNVKSKITIVAHGCPVLSRKPVWHCVYRAPFSLHRSLQTSSGKFLRVNPSVFAFSLNPSVLVHMPLSITSLLEPCHSPRTGRGHKNGHSCVQSTCISTTDTRPNMVCVVQFSDLCSRSQLTSCLSIWTSASCIHAPFSGARTLG